MFENKSIIIGVSGGIAAYKTAYLVSALSKTEADVNVIMTKNACEFISPLVFETLTGNKCYVDTFDRNFKFDVEHISLAKKADIFMIAPATANVIAKIANGIADDMLTTTFLASKCKKIVSPAMNTAMFENQITQDNIAKLKKYEIGVVEPRNGLLACGDTGAGKMPEPDFLFDVIEREIAREKDMLGKKVLVTAGATMESGFAIAKEAMLRGAEVTVVKANTTAEIPNFVKIVEVSSAKDMFDEVTALSDQQDIIVKAAAVADYTPESYVDSKIKKKDGDLSIPLKRTMDILKYLGENKKEGQFLCGFSMETDNMLENSKAKLSKKNADMIVANNLRDAGSGFKTDTNAVTLITRDGHRSLELKSKAEVAKEIFDEILGLI